MISIEKMTPIDEIKESDIEYRNKVFELSSEASDYLKSFAWCEKITKGWLAEEWGYIVCVFFFKIEPTKASNADSSVWIVVGDIPPAYIDVESATNVNEVLKSYVFLMEDWVECVREGKSVEDCYPVNVEPTKEFADMLESRIKMIKEDFIQG